MTSKTQTELFVSKRQIDNFGALFLLKIMIERKRKLDSFLFQKENNSKTFKNRQVMRAESPPLILEMNVHTAIFLKFAWSFFNIMHERVNCKN